MSRNMVVVLVACLAALCIALTAVPAQLPPGGDGRYTMQSHLIGHTLTVVVLDTHTGRVWRRDQNNPWDEYGSPTRVEAE